MCVCLFIAFNGSGCTSPSRNNEVISFIDSSIGDATYLNPILSTDSASGAINDLVFNGLVKYDKDLNIVGDLARSWTISPNGLIITFKLRTGVTWHDGIPFTAQDVRFTYEKLIDPKVKTPFGSKYLMVKKFEVLDDHTVRIFYREPFAPALISWGMGIIPQHIYKDGDFNAHPANRHPVGTGMFIFKEWKTDQKIVLEANPDFFEGKPGIDRFIYRIIPDKSVQFLELRNQSIDMMSLTPDMYNAYPEFFVAYNKFKYSSRQYTYLGFNLKNDLFKDKNVRKAIAYAINKKEIITGVLLGYGREATGPFTPSSWAFNPAVQNVGYDPDHARVLLKQAGWEDTDGDGILDREGKPFAFTLMTNQGNKTRELCAQIIQSQLHDVGIKVAIRIIEWSTFIHKFIDVRQFEAIILGWSLTADPDAYSIWHSSQMEDKKYNFVSYKNTTVDRLLVQGRTTFDQKKRQTIYYRIHELIADDMPYIFLYYPDALPVVHKRFRGPAVAKAGMGWNFREWTTKTAVISYE